MVATYVVGELEVLIWIHGDMNPEKGVLLWLIPQECIIEMDRGYDNMIGCTEAVSVSTLCKRCWNLILSSCIVTHLPHGLCIVSSLYTSIYSVDNLLYLYALPIITSLYFFSSLCLSATWALSKGHNTSFVILTFYLTSISVSPLKFLLGMIHWNPKHLLYLLLVYKTSSYTVIY